MSTNFPSVHGVIESVWKLLTKYNNSLDFSQYKKNAIGYENYEKAVYTYIYNIKNKSDEFKKLRQSPVFNGIPSDNGMNNFVSELNYWTNYTIIYIINNDLVLID